MFNTTTFEEPSLNNPFEEEPLNTSGWSTNIPDFFTELEFESLFYTKLLNFNKEGAKLELTNISELCEQNRYCLIPTEYISSKQEKQITINSSIPVVLYDETPDNFKMLRSQQKSTEKLLRCRVHVNKVYTFNTIEEAKSNAEPRKLIKAVDYDIMHKIYNKLKSVGFGEEEIQSDEACIKLFIKYMSEKDKAIMLMESTSRVIKAFPKSNYTKKVYKFYISARYIKAISISK